MDFFQLSNFQLIIDMASRIVIIEQDNGDWVPFLETSMGRVSLTQDPLDTLYSFAVSIAEGTAAELGLPMTIEFLPKPGIYEPVGLEPRFLSGLWMSWGRKAENADEWEMLYYARGIGWVPRERGHMASLPLTDHELNLWSNKERKALGIFRW